MTLLQLITIIREYFPNATEKEICQYVNELEKRMSDEIFSPAGLPCRLKPIEVKNDINTPLLLKDGYFSIYVNFITAVISLKNADFEKSQIYSDLFNQNFSDLAVHIRRNHIPQKNTPVTGGAF